MRVFISGDIEGCTGIVTWGQSGTPSSEHYDWPFARRMYTHDINAAIRGALAAGATRVVVKDSHNWCKNLLIDELEPGTELISGAGNWVGGMMHGIDESFDAAMLVGYHAMAGTENGILEHALVGGLHRFTINGEEAGEIAFSAATAGAYGVPLVTVTSDGAGCAEAASTIPGLTTFPVKEGMGRFMGKLLHPSETGPGIEGAARAGVAAHRDIAPYVIDGPVTMSLTFRQTHEAELACTLDGVRRVGGYTLEWEKPTFLEAARLTQHVFNLSMQARKLE